MKKLLLAGAAFLALSTSQLAAHADPIIFNFTGSVVPFTVPATDTYQILAFGAQGGTALGFGVGGKGAKIGGDISLTAGEILNIAVGAAGSARGGGGGSFVVGPDKTPLVVAGGGGGGGFFTGLLVPGQGGQIVQGNGQGGEAGCCGGGGGGGGGFFSDGDSGGPVGGIGGSGWPDLTGGADGGGYGGGGGASGGSGGGGGYSGGAGGGRSAVVPSAPGFGGDSFDAGTDQILVADFQTGNGEVIITELVPEPASLTILGVGLLGLTLVRKRRSRS